jgi:hypothetical protein
VTAGTGIRFPTRSYVAPATRGSSAARARARPTPRHPLRMSWAGSVDDQTDCKIGAIQISASRCLFRWKKRQLANFVCSLFESAGHTGEHGIQGGPHGVHRRDYGNGESASNDGVFDGSGSSFAMEKTSKQLPHDAPSPTRRRLKYQTSFHLFKSPNKIAIKYSVWCKGFNPRHSGRLGPAMRRRNLSGKRPAILANSLAKKIAERPSQDPQLRGICDRSWLQPRYVDAQGLQERADEVPPNPCVNKLTLHGGHLWQTIGHGPSRTVGLSRGDMPCPRQ